MFSCSWMVIILSRLTLSWASCSLCISNYLFLLMYVLFNDIRVLHKTLVVLFPPLSTREKYEHGKIDAQEGK